MSSNPQSPSQLEALARAAQDAREVLRRREELSDSQEYYRLTDAWLAALDQLHAALPPDSVLSLLSDLREARRDSERLQGFFASMMITNLVRRSRDVQAAWEAAHPNGGLVTLESVRAAVDVALAKAPAIAATKADWLDGEWTKPRESCPDCGAHLLVNSLGVRWCSHVRCSTVLPPAATLSPSPAPQ